MQKGDFNYVVIDPKLARQTGFAKLADFIRWVDGGRDSDATEALRKLYDPFSHLSPAERRDLRERIRQLVQIEGKSVRQAAIELQMDEKQLRWLLRHGT